MALTVTTIYYFWSSSRYPALNEKANLGGDNEISGLAFDNIFSQTGSDSNIQQVLQNLTNWAITNKQGMLFGLLLSALILTLFQFIRQKQFKSSFTNTLLGVAIGAPMGICVNCSVPVAIGLHQSGSKLETTLAALFSSPTLNIIIFSMLITFFPLWLVFLKLGMSLFIILFITPYIARKIQKSTDMTYALNEINLKEKKITVIDPLQQSSGVKKNGAFYSWLSAIVLVLKTVFINIITIVRKTLPFMILAGIIGAIIITWLPWETLNNLHPSNTYIISLVFFSIIGTLLPVPIAFDVVITSILFSLGMDIGYVATLLFTLGIFSIYPMLQLGYSISWKLSIWLFTSVVISGILVGLMANFLSKNEQVLQREIIFDLVKPAQDNRTVQETQKSIKTKPEHTHAPVNKNAFHLSSITNIQAQGQEVRINWSLYNDKKFTTTSKSLFTRKYGELLGITEPLNLSLLRFFPPISNHRSIASGDVNKDGWPDIIITSERGVSLYINNEGKNFFLKNIEIKPLADFYFMNAALIDFDGDDDLDIIAGTLSNGIVFIPNNEGEFSNYYKEENHHTYAIAATLAFGDLDRDGDLDMILGNKAIGNSNYGKINRSHIAAKNFLYSYENGRYIRTPMQGVAAETMSILLSDLNGDDWLDVFIGNDYSPPDRLELSDGKGGYKILQPENEIVKSTSRFTMSITSADIDGDLIPEVFLGNISGRRNAVKKTPTGLCQHESVQNQPACLQLYSDLVPFWDARKFANARKCHLSRYSEECAILALTSPTMVRGNTGKKAIGDLCKEIPSKWPKLIKLCEARLNSTITKLNTSELLLTLNSNSKENILLKRDSYNSSFSNIAKALHIENGGWTWNAKFADLDLDGKQDLYLVTGDLMAEHIYTDKLYLNQGDIFKKSTLTNNLASSIPTTSYTYVDIDRDGDLDIITVPQIGDAKIYISNAKQKNTNSIVIILSNNTHNTKAIGAKIIIRYGDNSEFQQMREIQASGGFNSFDEPIAHFGLGKYQFINSMEIHWPNGKLTNIDNSIAANRYYFIKRL